ncbi:hypothetical protein PTTG_03591, partial [Puccinia triticina 1-1 BBBD Race 1]
MGSNPEDGSISPSDYSKWFHHPITPPSKQHVPGLFDGTAHLVKTQNRRRAAFIRSQQAAGATIDPSLLASQPEPHGPGYEFYSQEPSPVLTQPNQNL